MRNPKYNVIDLRNQTFDAFHEAQDVPPQARRALEGAAAELLGDSTLRPASIAEYISAMDIVWRVARNIPTNRRGPS